METEKTIPGHQNQGADPSLAELVHQAQESEEADSRLTIMQALVKYKKAVWWAMFLSTSLIMEGYDLVLVSLLSL